MTDATIFQTMQVAVEAAQKSPHDTSKVGAALLLADGGVISAHNIWPAAIEKAFGRDAKIGNASGTIHGEMGVFITAAQQQRATQDARLFITDPPCPNCAKNIAEAGIVAVYIDHKGFDKDFAQRRIRDFQALSLAIFAHAGIAVYTVFRKQERVETMLHPSAPLAEAPKRKGAPYAACTAHDKAGEPHEIMALMHPSLGYDPAEPELDSAKYSYDLQPLNRMLMMAARQGLRIDGTSVYSSRVPTSRELVNIVGAGITHLQIGDDKKARDIHGPQALKQLTSQGILKT